MTVICDYCGQPAELVDGTRIYPHRPDLGRLKFWLCEPCDAYVGCHKPNRQFGFDGTQPLGRLADEELRHWKSETHRTFDPLWRETPGYFRTRRRAYAWLAQELKLKPEDCHIGMFDVATCQAAIKSCLTLMETEEQ